MSSDLQDFIEGKQKFLKMQPNDEFIGYYFGHKVIPDKFKLAEDENAKTVLWNLKTEKGKMLEWTCGNLSAVTGLGALKVGEKFHMKRIGMGPKTNYQVTNLSKLASENGEQVPF